jgi:hypothetical protein
MSVPFPTQGTRFVPAGSPVFTTTRWTHVLLHLVVALCAAAIIAEAAEPPPSNVDARVNQARLDLERAAGGPVKVVPSRLHGLATFIAAGDGRLIPVNAPAAAPPEQRAESFIISYGAALGVKDAKHNFLWRGAGSEGRQEPSPKTGASGG